MSSGGFVSRGAGSCSTAECTCTAPGHDNREGEDEGEGGSANAVPWSRSRDREGGGVRGCDGYHRFPPPYTAETAAGAGVSVACSTAVGAPSPTTYRHHAYDCSHHDDNNDNREELEEEEELDEGEEGEGEGEEEEEEERWCYRPLPPRHAPAEETGVLCRCPVCLFNSFVAFFFSSQRRSSPHVLAALPSAYIPNGYLPPLPVIPDPELHGRCPIYSAWGFCPHSIGCYLAHDAETEAMLRCAGPATRAEIRAAKPARQPLLPRGRSADEELERLRRKAARRLDEDIWTCDVCGFDEITDQYYSAVGEVFYYRHCPQCYLMCYLPEVTYLLEHILWDAVDDYQKFKEGVERYRELVPDEFKVPLSSEAHNLATTVFAWSLVSPKDIQYAMDAAYRVLPSLSSVVSIGSGIGYVEHLFNRVMNDVDLPASGPVVAWRAACEGERAGSNRLPSSIAKNKACFYGERHVPVYAFDELERRYEFSVHVSLGGPLSVLSVDCANSVLLLCWPPFGSPTEEQSSMGYEALEYFRQRGGRVLIFIGDVSSTGDWRFHELRDRHYKLVREYSVRREVKRWYPQEMGLVYAGNDTIGVYERRPESL